MSERISYFFVLYFVKIKCARNFLEDLSGLPVGEAVQVEGPLVEFHCRILLLSRRVDCLFRYVLGLTKVLLDYLLLLGVTKVRTVISLSVVEGGNGLRSAFAD